jgi:hypothetical protein
MPAAALGIILTGLLAIPAGAAEEARPSPAEAPISCREAASHRQCLLGCAPANLIFLPCMAVGAKAMAACREREVAGCIETCRRKYC